MRRLLLTGVGLVLVLYLLPVFYPSETDKTEAAGTHRKRHSGSNRRLNHHGSGERQGAGNAAGDLCGRRDGGRDCGRFSG